MEVEVADSFEIMVVNYDTEAVINRKTTIQANPATHSSAYLPKKDAITTTICKHVFNMTNA
jgi:hypothetical protein